MKRPDPPRVHSARRRLSREQVEQLVADYRAGIPTTQLTTKYNPGKRTVLRLLEANGVERRNRSLTPDDCAEATALYLDGWSLARVADRLGVTPSTVHNRLRERGVAMRDTQGRPR